ncbi:MAG TPA: hypothetical protein VFB58_17000 [Chloroflexota bacterium]|nr:hypothetical protein [Chloroflexota bacterium]
MTATSAGATKTQHVHILSPADYLPGAGFQRITMGNRLRVGDRDRVTIQATLHLPLAVWIRVVFPTGKQLMYRGRTNARGFWSIRFTIPRSAASPFSHKAYIVFRLWHGSRLAETYRFFTLQ